ncbi:MAG: hypothetical protein ABSC22_02060, partial [Roseiarcus sp.]
MKAYKNLFKRYSADLPETTFSHSYAIGGDYDEPFKLVARQTIDGIDAWCFHQDRFKQRHPNSAVP